MYLLHHYHSITCIQVYGLSLGLCFITFISSSQERDLRLKQRYHLLCKLSICAKNCHCKDTSHFVLYACSCGCSNEVSFCQIKLQGGMLCVVSMIVPISKLVPLMMTFLCRVIATRLSDAVQKLNFQHALEDTNCLFFICKVQ